MTVSRKVAVWVPWCVSVTLTDFLIHTSLVSASTLSRCRPTVFRLHFNFLPPPISSSSQRLPNGPSSGLEDSELERQREGEIERQRAELSQLRERLALMCRQVSAHIQQFVLALIPLLGCSLGLIVISNDVLII